MYKTAGTTSHTISLLFGGTATINNIIYNYTEGEITGQFPTLSAAQNIGSVTAATATVVTNAIGVASKSVSLTLNGTVSVNAGGTFIPQYQLSATPGGAYTTAAGAFFLIYPIGASGANTSVGTWA